MYLHSKDLKQNSRMCHHALRRWIFTEKTWKETVGCVIMQQRDMGWFKKSCSIKVEKKCNEKWRWPSRELKTWYMWNNITVSIFPKKDFSYFDSFSWYSHLNVWFWQFWPSPNMFKTCIEIVLCEYFLLPKLFYPR